MSSSLFGGGERPPSTPDMVKPSPPSTASPTLTPPTPAPDSKDPCTLHPSCRPTQVEIDRRGDLILVIGDVSCAVKNFYESREVGQPEHTLQTDHQLEELAEKQPTATELERDPKVPKQVQTSIAFRICSRTLARAAPFFDAMLYGHFAEASRPESSGPESEWTVLLPDDSTWVMGLLLPVIHGRFSEFDPRVFQGTGGLRHLYEVTVLTDKYDMTQILHPWASQLVQSLKESIEHLNGLDLARALWISWELGSKAVFKLVINQLVWKQPKYDFDIFVPPGAKETIRDSRLEAITALFRPIKDTIEASIFQQEMPAYGFRCLEDHGATSTCNQVILGSLMQSLGPIGMWPLPSAEDWEGTVAELQQTLFTKLHIREYDRHYYCQRGVQGRDGRVLWCPEPTVAITNKQEEHLTRQASKLGLTDG